MPPAKAAPFVKTRSNAPRLWEQPPIALRELVRIDHAAYNKPALPCGQQIAAKCGWPAIPNARTAGLLAKQSRFPFRMFTAI
jgi:hypothetical protein